jgi:uncharacterized protein
VEGRVPRVTYPGVYVEERSTGIRAISGVETSTTGFVGPTRRGFYDRSVRVASFAEFKRAFGSVSGDSDLSHAVRHFFANGGRDARIVRVRKAKGSADPDAASFRAALARLEGSGIGLLCIPDLVRARPDNAQLPLHPEHATLYAEAASLCERIGAFLLIDPPPDVTTAAQAATWRSSLPTGTSHAAAYFPRLHMLDPLTGATRALAPSGTVAGIMARMDRTHGVWKAAAGVEAIAREVTQLATRPTQRDQERLNAAGINCFRDFKERGIVLFGARTLATDSLWKYVPVRRFAIFLARSIDEGIDWVVHEPNGAPLWAEIRQQVSSFMQDLFAAGAFQGRKPNEAYFVKCDASTMTPGDIANGIVNILVGFAPLKPAEFVVLRLSQMTCRNCP